MVPDDFLELCRSVTAKRPKAVIDHILQHGFITTEELKKPTVITILQEQLEMSEKMVSR